MPLPHSFSAKPTVRAKTMGLGFLDKEKKGFPLDGQDQGASYQMVPQGGQRDLIMLTDRSPCVLSIQDSNKCLMKDFTFLDGGGRVPDTPEPGRSVREVRLPPNATVRFSVMGNSIGFTGLKFVEDSEFQISSSVTISVKPRKTVRFSLVFLADLIHKNVRGQIEPRFLMDVVKKIYLEQSNVDLQETGHLRDVTVLRDLGDPILASSDKVLDSIENATGDETFGTVDFIVYCCWNIERERGKNDTRGLKVNRNNKSYAFIEVARSGFAEQAHILAHEIGHVLGLGHTKENGLMFPNTNGKANRLFGGDIEVLNPASN